MGLYVNPGSTTKEQWLDRHGQEVERNQAVISDDFMPVVLIDSGFFTAAAIAFSKDELKALLDAPMDPRPKRIFMCKVADLRAVQPALKNTMSRVGR